MLEFSLFVLGTIGLTNILVHGYILDLIGVRPWVKDHVPADVFSLFECYECSGFWSGLVMGILMFAHSPVYYLPCAFAGAALGHFYTTLVNMIESKTELVLDHDHEEENC